MQNTPLIPFSFIFGILSAVLAAWFTFHRRKAGHIEPSPAEPSPAKIREPTDWRTVLGVFNLVSAGALILVGIYLLIAGGAWVAPVPIATANLYYAYDALVKRAKA